MEMDMIYRKTCRGQLTKVVKAALEYLETKHVPNESIYEEIAVHLAKVKSAHIALKEADQAVRSLIKEENYTTECNTIIEYDEKATAAIARLECRISALRESLACPQMLPSSNQQSSSNDNVLHQNATNEMNGRNSSGIKLPKLELKKFNGEFSQWVPFWEQFRTSIHLNSCLDGSTKFNYLQTVLTGKAASTIAGLTPSEACYNEAIEMLKEEYGSPDRIIDKYVQQLMTIPHIKSSTDAVSLRRLYSQLTSTMRSLSALSVTPAQYNIMLKTIILQALPSDLRAAYHRKVLHSHNVTETTTLETTMGNIECDPQLKNLLSFIKCEVESLERASSVSNERKQLPIERNFLKQRTATGLFTLSQTAKNCFFCNSKQHVAKDCDSTTDDSPKERET